MIAEILKKNKFVFQSRNKKDTLDVYNRAVLHVESVMSGKIQEDEEATNYFTVCREYLKIYHDIYYNAVPLSYYDIGDDIGRMLAFTDIEKNNILEVLIDEKVTNHVHVFKVSRATFNYLIPWEHVGDGEDDVLKESDIVLIYVRLWDYSDQGYGRALEIVSGGVINNCITSPIKYGCMSENVQDISDIMWQTYYIFVFNCLLYTQSHPDWIDRVEMPLKTTQKKHGGRKKNDIRIENNCRVVRYVNIPKQIKKHIRASDFTDPQYTINKRFMVRGHWRNQPCGEKNSKTKLIFIAPFWKGHEDDPLIDHIYEVK